MDYDFIRDHIKTFTVRLDYAGGVMAHEEERPFTENVKFEFINSSIVYGYKVYDDSNHLVWEEKFPAGPFVIPGAGGTIEIQPYALTIDDVPIYDIMNIKKPKKSPYRSITDSWEQSW